MNKRTIVLCFILLLLIVIVLNRWEIWWDIHDNYAALFKYDKITSTLNTTFRFAGPQGRGNYYTNYENQAYTTIVTIFLYSSIAATILALLKEAKDINSSILQEYKELPLFFRICCIIIAFGVVFLCYLWFLH